MLDTVSPKCCCSVAGPDALGLRRVSCLRGSPMGHDQCPFSLPGRDWAGWEATPAAALPEPMAIKGPEMELDGGARLLLTPERDCPICPRRPGLPGRGNRGLEGGERPRQPRAESRGWGTCHVPLCPLQGTRFWPCPEKPGICITSHGGLRRGIKLPFHQAPELWGGGGWEVQGAHKWAPPLAPHRISPDNGRLLLGFYMPGPLLCGPAGDILPPPHSHGDSKGTDAP